MNLWFTYHEHTDQTGLSIWDRRSGQRAWLCPLHSLPVVSPLKDGIGKGVFPRSPGMSSIIRTHQGPATIVARDPLLQETGITLGFPDASGTVACFIREQETLHDRIGHLIEIVCGGRARMLRRPGRSGHRRGRCWLRGRFLGPG